MVAPNVQAPTRSPNVSPMMRDVQSSQAQRQAGQWSNGSSRVDAERAKIEADAAIARARQAARNSAAVGAGTGAAVGAGSAMA